MDRNERVTVHNVHTRTVAVPECVKLTHLIFKNIFRPVYSFNECKSSCLRKRGPSEKWCSTPKVLTETATGMKSLRLPFNNEHKHPAAVTIGTFGPCLNPSSCWETLISPSWTSALSQWLLPPLLYSHHTYSLWFMRKPSLACVFQHRLASYYLSRTAR